MPGFALTYDDGPDAMWTPRLLDLLDELDVCATFFPIAPRAAAAPELIARMLDAGHVVGVHCDAHIRHSERARTDVAVDTDRALGTLRELGAAPALWRTPWGDRAPFTAELAAERGLRLVDWTVDTHDWRGDSGATMFAAGRAALKPGAIVLAHDGLGPGARRHDVAETLRFTALAVADARSRGLEPEPLQ